MIKTKYEITTGRKVMYSCVTTTRNCEDMINILSKRFDNNGFPYRIVQTQDDVKNIVHDNFSRPVPKEKHKLQDYRRKGRPVIDNETGQVYQSMTKLAGELRMYREVLKRLLEKNIPNFKYSFLKQSCEGKY